ncbi:MAG: ABC transporter substrate-binding protein [Holosporaceae bacterium]|jgi:putative ABC transport system substrate-binding protein|nr:ABC transporter substrate-binding protein [Holosporaceae bacterium]
MKKGLSIAATVAAVLLVGCRSEKQEGTPLVAIVNYGQIPPLLATVTGIKKELLESGYVENKNVRYEIADIAFDHTLISQSVMNLKNHKPKVMVVISTPIAQFAKGKIRDIPLVYGAITDPVDAKLINVPTESVDNITGSSDMQSLSALLTLVRSILPQAKTIGMLYATSDCNDAALIKKMQQETKAAGMTLITIPVDQMRDVPVHIQELKGKVDLIYVGASGLQSALAVISGEAGKMNIPVFNIEEQSVRDGLALASFGVNYESVGRNAGKLVAKLLNGSLVKDLAPFFPKLEDHKCFVNRKLAKKFNVKIPGNATVVE